MTRSFVRASASSERSNGGGASRPLRLLRGASRAALLGVALLALLSGLGCAKYHRFRPTAVEHAGIARGGDMSDASVVSYVDRTRDILRKRFHLARNVRQTSSTAQILLAGGASLAAAFSAGSTAVATLAAGSAGIPQLAEVFDTGSRATAYQQAVEKISQAETAYFKARAGSSPVVPQNRLTIEGALLLEAVNGATDAVELFQAGMLPTIESLQRAEAVELRRRAAANESRGGGRVVVRRRETPVVITPRPPEPGPVTPNPPTPVDPIAPTPPTPVDPVRPDPAPVGPVTPTPDTFDEQAARVSLGARIGRLPAGESARILGKFGRSTGSSETSARERLKTFISEARGDTLRELDKTIP